MFFADRGQFCFYTAGRCEQNLAQFCCSASCQSPQNFEEKQEEGAAFCLTLDQKTPSKRVLGLPEWSLASKTSSLAVFPPNLFLRRSRDASYVSYVFLGLETTQVMRHMQHCSFDRLDTCRQKKINAFWRQADHKVDISLLDAGTLFQCVWNGKFINLLRNLVFPAFFSSKMHFPKNSKKSLVVVSGCHSSPLTVVVVL